MKADGRVLGVAGIAAAIDAAAWMTAEGQREAAMRRPTDAPAEIDVLGKLNQEWFKEHKCLCLCVCE